MDKVYIVYESVIHQMCDIFHEVRGVFKNEKDALKELEHLKNIGDEYAYIQYVEVK